MPTSALRKLHRSDTTLGTSALVADDSDDLHCIAEKVVVSDIEVVGSRGNPLDIRYRITNHLPFAIGGASVEVTINAKNRPVYLERKTSSIAATIAGGLMWSVTLGSMPHSGLRRSAVFCTD